MYTLTVDADSAVTVSEHPDRDAAHRALMHYVVAADYYLRPIQSGPARTTYELLALPDPDADPAPSSRPRTAGHATIKEQPAKPAPS